VALERALLLVAVDRSRPANRPLIAFLAWIRFCYMAQHPEEAANFDKVMSSFTTQIAMALTVLEVPGGGDAFAQACHPRLG
jgi:hypothetical protein